MSDNVIQVRRMIPKEESTPPPPSVRRETPERRPGKPEPRGSERAEPPRRHRHGDALVFAPAAWAKLMFFLHAGGTEVGGFGISSEDDPLYVREFRTVRQRTSVAAVEFDDAAVAEHFDDCVDQGLKPERFARIWVHTHPGDSAEPSLTDERTFARVFGACDWALMFIASRGGRTYARLSFAAGPGAALHLPVAVDWAAWPAAVLDERDRWESELAGWAAEYERNVHPAPPGFSAPGGSPLPPDRLPRRGGAAAAAGDADALYDAILEERLDGWAFDPWSDDVHDLPHWLADGPELAVWP